MTRKTAHRCSVQTQPRQALHPCLAESADTDPRTRRADRITGTLTNAFFSRMTRTSCFNFLFIFKENLNKRNEFATLPFLVYMATFSAQRAELNTALFLEQFFPPGTGRRLADHHSRGSSSCFWRWRTCPLPWLCYGFTGVCTCPSSATVHVKRVQSSYVNYTPTRLLKIYNGNGLWGEYYILYL